MLNVSSTQFNVKQLFIFPARCIFGFLLILRTSGHYFPYYGNCCAVGTNFHVLSARNSYLKGSALTHATSHRLYVKTWVWCRVSSCEICGGRGVLGQVVLRVLSFSCLVYFHQCPVLIFILISGIIRASGRSMLFRLSGEIGQKYTSVFYTSKGWGGSSA